MFAPEDPRLFGLPPGVDFPAALVAGLEARLAGALPEAMARVEVIVNTRRMARRLREIFDAGPARLLPRIRLVTDLGEVADLAHVPPAAPPLRRRLELVQLIAALIEREPAAAPRDALYDLADSLADLMDEMGAEGVAPATVMGLDVSDQSGHWQRALRFLKIAETYIGQADVPPDAGSRQRDVIARTVSRWQAAPPDHPVIVAGSTGSRGATAMLMQAVARLPQGAVVLPGFDFTLPDAVWAGMDEGPRPEEDHPQYRFRPLMTALGLAPGDVARWHDMPEPNAARNRLVSLALRPAPVTDQWLSDGPGLGELSPAAEGVTLLEAPGQREEAAAIALRLRQAAENGQRAALITPDRTLTRQVTAALARWGIMPDDSAGQPLPLSPPGRFLRLVAGLFEGRLTAGALLALLKHPLTHSGADRNRHLLFTRELELHLRREGVPYPEPRRLSAFAEARSLDGLTGWAAWLADTACGRDAPGPRPLSERVRAHLHLAEALAAGPDRPGAGGLWDRDAGRKARAVMDELATEADRAGHIDAHDYSRLLSSVLGREEVHDGEEAHPHIRIWGTLEARVQGAELLILGSLNEGAWPEPVAPDPWLNRAMRQRAGLLSPERGIGLAAHDFQQAVGAQEVWLTRSVKDEGAQTVPSRWLNRLTNLMNGLPHQGGDAALAAMRARGEDWLALAARLDEAPPAAPAHRPSPRPPADARPARLSVTEIQKLIRDPYAIYARHVLRLRPLDPLDRPPDALLRGIVAHSVLEGFVRDRVDAPERMTEAELLSVAREVLRDALPWASTRTFWLARLARVAPWFVRTEATRRARARAVAFEARGAAEITDLGFTLSSRADRIDRGEDGALWLYDYKTGTPPSAKEQAAFDKQLLLTAAMAERGAFEALGPAPVAGAAFVGLGAKPEEVAAPLDAEPPAEVWARLRDLVALFQDPGKGFTSRHAVKSERMDGEYDHLARFGEWDDADDPLPEDLA